jgi:hypothetical protein
MIVIQSSNTTISQILAAHGCQTTAYRIATVDTHCLVFLRFPFRLAPLRSSSAPLEHTLPNDNHTDTSLRGGGVPVCDAGGDSRHSGTELVCLARCISGVCVIPVIAPTHGRGGVMAAGWTDD